MIVVCVETTSDISYLGRKWVGEYDFRYTDYTTVYAILAPSSKVVRYFLTKGIESVQETGKRFKYVCLCEIANT